MIATLKSSSSFSTGISKPYTSSVVPSEYVTSSVVGSISSAPSACASSFVPTKTLTMFLDTRLTWMVIFPSFTVRTPFPSFASLTWNILLSVLKSAVYVPSSSSDALLSPAVSAADALSAETSDVDVLLSALDTSCTEAEDASAAEDADTADAEDDAASFPPHAPSMDTVSAAPRKRTANFFLIIKFLLVSP